MNARGSGSASAPKRQGEAPSDAEGADENMAKRTRGEHQVNSGGMQRDAIAGDEGTASKRAHDDAAWEEARGDDEDAMEDRTSRMRRKVTCFDDAEGFQEDEQDDEAAGCFDGGLGDVSGCEPPAPEELAAFDAARLVTTDGTQDSFSQGGGEMAEQRLRRVRLRGKQSAEGTWYGGRQLDDRRLVTLREVKVARKRNAVVQATNRRLLRGAMARATSRAARDVSTVNSMVDEGGWTDEAQCDIGETPHVTHELRTSPGLDVIYCRVCGAWSQGKRLRSLGKPCHRDGKRSGSVRLLQLGLLPVKGAVIPSHLKRKRGGGGRKRKC